MHAFYSPRSVRSVLRSIVVMAGAVLTLGACGGMFAGGPPPAGYTGPYGPGAQGAQGGQAAETKCDSKGCSDFCMNMRCMYDEMGIDKCMAVCTSRCGDGYFEEQDKGVLECVLKVGPDLSCSGEKACCEEHLTNQLCP